MASATAVCCASTTRPTRSTRRCCWRPRSGSSPATTSGCAPPSGAIAEELTENGFVLRYRTEETDDGLSGKEGTFLICSFWLVSALAIVGELQRARDLMERLLRVASPLGLYAEEFDAETGRHLGNFPQAFSHLALLEAAGRTAIIDCPSMLEAAAMRNVDPYDVIIIGTGAGGGTLARHLAPVRQAHPAARARRLAAPRAAELARRRTCSSTTATSRPTPGTTSSGKPFQPQIHYFVGGATKLYGAALYRLRARGLRRAPATTTASRRRGRSPTTSWSRTTRRPSSCTRCTAPAARTRPSRRRARPYPFPAVSHEPRIQQLSDDLAAAGYHPFHAPCGILLDEANCPTARACAARTATASRASCTRKSDAEVLGVRPALEHPNVTLLTNAQAVQLETERRPARR